MAESTSYPVPSLIGGISEQAPQSRPSSSCEDQLNCINDPLNDCIARPGGTVKAVIQYDMDEPFEHTIRRSATEQYKILIENGAMKIINLIDGTDCTKKRFAHQDVRMDKYLKHTGVARNAFAAVTVEDTTFIVNRQKDRESTSQRCPGCEPQQGHLLLPLGDLLHDLRRVDHQGRGDLQVPPTPPLTTPTAAMRPYIQTNVLAKAFRDASRRALRPSTLGRPQSWLGFTAATIGGSTTGGPQMAPQATADDYKVSASRGSSVIITGPAGTDFDLDSSDGQGDTQLIAFTDTIKKFTDLPDQGSSRVRREGAGGSLGPDRRLLPDVRRQGYAERLGGDLQAGHQDHAQWTPPRCRSSSPTSPRTPLAAAEGSGATGWLGDGDKTAKTPRMVNRRIRDLNFITGRLCIIGEGFHDLSRASNAYNFFPDTAQAKLDTDPISVEIATGGVTVVKQSVALSGKLYLWGDGAQLRMDNGDSTALSQDTIDHIPSTNYEFDGRFRPVPIGAGSCGLRDDRGQLLQAQGGHVPQRLGGGRDTAQCPLPEAHPGGPQAD
jgi:hypothetical protein